MNIEQLENRIRCLVRDLGETLQSLKQIQAGAHLKNQEILIGAVKSLIDFVSLDFALRRGKTVMGEEDARAYIDRAYKELDYFWNKLEDIGRKDNEEDEVPT